MTWTFTDEDGNKDQSRVDSNATLNPNSRPAHRAITHRSGDAQPQPTKGKKTTAVKVTQLKHPKK